MTVSSTDSKVIFTGSGTTGPFAFTFKVFEDTDLVVTKYTIADGSEELLDITSDYTVTLDPTIGGHIDLVASLSSSYKLIIQRVIPLTQTADYVANDPFPAETHEEVADRAVMITQQLKEEVDRSLKADATQTGVDFTLPGPVASQVIGWNSDADGLVNLDLADLDILAKASQAEAQAGTEDTHYMTPLKTADAITAQAATTAQLNALKSAAVAYVIDGGGATITTGVKGDIRFPFDVTITKVSLLADQAGSIVIDLWKDTYANFPPTVADTITASAKPTLSTADKSEDSTLTGWTKAIASGSSIRINVDSITTCTRVTLTIEYTRA